ncbi:MAG: hypothetical protein MUF32_05250 [Burkholderiaceae bacterium]|jgi:hypothetical protein|nr:hypothetical protein [Burkholderiaceae bacterium]
MRLSASRRLPTQTRRLTGSLGRLAASGGLAALLGLGLPAGAADGGAGPLLIAPMVHGVDLCAPPAGAQAPLTEPELAKYCRASGRSAAPVIEAALSRLSARSRTGANFELGYTMPVPLLKLFRPGGAGWEVDQAAIERLALTVQETDRPVVLHLFSTHFGVGAPLEEALARDPANLAATAAGPMPKDRYYGLDIYPWTIASTDNDITRHRQLAIDRFVEAICRLPGEHRRKIRAVSLLGELHHFHADFERGMGIGGPYEVSDYSDASVRGFREFLAERFDGIGALNRAVGERYASFADVMPPGAGGATAADRRRSARIDSSAHGSLPLSGWAFDTRPGAGGPLWVRIYRDGSLIARVPARYGRQDVAQAKPAFGTADVGWRHDMDFAHLAAGEYRIDVLVERSDGTLARLGSRRIFVDTPGQAASAREPQAAMLPVTDAAGIEGSIDSPADGATVVFNPLVPLWHEFRNRQVLRYLAVFERQLRSSCLGDVPLYTHQIAPFVNPGWDAGKFAVDASLREAGGLALGISLYGEATYGTSFLDFLATTRHRVYGVTEFHPLRPMTAGELAATLERHRRHGAAFVSFFIDARPLGSRDSASSNFFAFDPSNPMFGSDRLYESLQTVLGD